MALASWHGIDMQKPASLSAYGLDSATPPRVYTFSAEHSVCTHSNHRLLRKEETLRVIITQVQSILQVAALFRSLTRGMRLLHAALYRINIAIILISHAMCIHQFIKVSTYLLSTRYTT